MFDISWGEMMLIGAAALIFIGPKELPATLRAVGQMVGKVKRMAGEFRTQFDDAMREADVASVKKEFDSMNEAASSASTFNPIESIRNEIKSAVNPSGEARPADTLPDPVIPAPDPAPPLQTADFAAPAPAETAAPQPQKPKAARKAKARSETKSAAKPEGGADA